MAARLTDFAAQAEKALASGREKAAVALVERSLESDGTEPALSSFALRYGFKTCAAE